MEDVLLFTAGAARRRRARRRPGPPPVQALRRRRVPGRLAAPVRAARPLARRSRRALRGRRPRPDDLLLRRRQRRLPARLPAALPRHHLDRAGPQLPLQPRGRRPPPTPCWPARPAGASSCARSARPGPPVTYTAPTPTRWPRPRPSPPGSPRCATGGVPPGEMAVLFRINAQSEAFEDALTSRGIPYVVRGAARFFDRPEVRQAVTLLRGTARAGQAGDGLVDDRPRRRSPAWAGAREAPAGARPGPRPLGVAAGAGRPGRGVRAGGRAPTSATSSTTSTGGPPSSTPRSPTASPSRTLHAAKGLEWDAVFLVGLQEGTLPDLVRRDPGRDRGGAAPALRRHHPRPASTSASPGRWPATPAAGRRASRRASSTRCCPRSRRGARRRAARRGVAELPRVRPAAGDRGGEEARALRRLPGVLRRGAVRAAARVAQGARRRGERAGVRRVHRRHPPADRRAQAAHARRPCCGSTASAAPSSSGTATTCWPWSSDQPSRQFPETFAKYPQNRLPITEGPGSFLASTAHTALARSRPRHRRRWTA